MIRSLQHVGLAVPNLEVGRRFYTAFGLESNERGNELALRCAGRAQDQIRLLQGPKKKLAWVSFGTAAAELPALKRALESRGAPFVEAPVREDADGIWFRDPDGDVINVRVAEAAPVNRAVLSLNNPGEFRRLAARGVAVEADPPVKPRRLGHLIKFTTNVDRMVTFYTEALGMKLTDRVQDKIAFMRCGNGGDHHVLGVALAEGPGLHHLSFEVSSVDEIERGAQNLVAAGYKSAFGLGRHVLGSNYFHYLRDPWMSLVEYFWDIDHIPEGADWKAENVGLGPRAVAAWPPGPPPADFTKNYEIAQ
jgi:catechol 2,3-dioxygenase-like lactoylglutathione lyase family enzyme